jgi:pilus assembly protein CpaB
MNRARPFILLGAAALIALVTTLLIYNWLQKKSGVGQTAVLKTRPVVVALTDLTWGSAITKPMLGTKPFMGDSLPPGVFSDPANIVGRVVISPIKKGEPVFESRLAPVELNKGGVAAVLAPNRRAMAIKVDKVVGVSGFIHPGNRVDVLVTMANKQGESSTTMTKVVLENMLVLATGPQVEETGKQEKSTPVDVITLEVTPEEGEKLALAATEGKVVLALRSYTDTAAVKTRGTTIPTLMSSLTEGTKFQPGTKARVVKKEEPAPRVFTVQLYQGSRLTQQTTERGE